MPLDKAAFRTRVRAARSAAMTDDSFASNAAKLAESALTWLKTFDDGKAAVCAYISTGAEPPTTGLLKALAESGRSVYVPVCEPGHQLSWVLWHEEVPMARSLLAPVLEPVGQRHAFEELGQVAALFIPALAVDLSGTRLGQGGGYYDRFLALRARKVAAVVYEHEVLPAGRLPHDDLDMAIAAAVTPSGHHTLGVKP